MKTTWMIIRRILKGLHMLFMSTIFLLMILYCFIQAIEDGALLLIIPTAGILVFLYVIGEEIERWQ